MKNRILIAGIALIAMAFAACKDNSAFTLSGSVTNPGSVKKIYLLQTDTPSRITVVDSTNLSEDGKFQFKHAAPYFNLFRLRVGSSLYDFIAHNGDEIKFSTDMNDAKHLYTVTGSEESVKIQEYNKISNEFADKNNKVMAAYQAEAQRLGKESDSLIKAFMPQVQDIQKDYSIATLKFVRNNEETLAGFYAATSLDQQKYEQQLIAYTDDIKGGFKDNPAVQLFIKQMQALKPISIGHSAPDFALPGADGKPVKLSDYKGKYVMLDFWASWCGPCRQEMPNVVKQYAAYKGKGLNILGISLDESKTDWQKAIADLHMTWAQASELQKWDGPTERAYMIQAIPANFIIDPQGVIVAKNLTGSDLEEFLNKTFNQAQ